MDPLFNLALMNEAYCPVTPVMFANTAYDIAVSLTSAGFMEKLPALFVVRKPLPPLGTTRQRPWYELPQVALPCSCPWPHQRSRGGDAPSHSGINVTSPRAKGWLGSICEPGGGGAGGVHSLERIRTAMS